MSPPQSSSHRRRFTALVAPILLAVALAGCAKSADSADVVSLSSPGDNATGTTQPAKEPAKDPKDAALEFAKCMREHGIDMPDPKVNDGGGIMIGGPNDKGKVDKDALDGAQKACQPIMDNVVMDPAKKPSPEEEAKMREQALAFSKCMREHGVDMPDPTFEDGGRMSMAMKGDPDEPTFQAAQKACQQFMAGPIGGGPGEVQKSDGDGTDSGPSFGTNGGPAGETNG